MKRIILIWWLTVLAVSAKPGVASSQGFEGMAMYSAGFAGMLSKYCGQDIDFSSKMEVTLILTNHPLNTYPGNLAFLRGNLRYEVDATDLPNIPPKTANLMKQLHANQIVFLVRLDKKAIYMLFPGLEAYMEVPISDSYIQKADNLYKSAKLEKWPLDNEILDSHPCAKTKVVSSASKGDEATIWYAQDLHEFPIKIQSTEAIFHFKDVDLAKPESILFEIPPNYRLETNSQAIIELGVRQFRNSNTNSQ